MLLPAFQPSSVYKKNQANYFKNRNYFQNWFGLCLQPAFVNILYVLIIIDSEVLQWNMIDQIDTYTNT